MTCLVAAVARVGAVSLMQVRLRLRTEMIDAVRSLEWDDMNLDFEWLDASP
jgi:hypothetical protein